MKLTFLGADHEVTGSCYYLEAAGKKILVDCGMEQGPDLYENKPLPVAAGDIDMVLLTHAHIDHSGNLPLLYRHGFHGQIFSTYGTANLCSIMLLDSAHIQEFEAEWKNRKNQRAGRELVEPLYSIEDAQGAIKCFVNLNYEEERYIADGIKVRFFDAGHLLGSASIEVTITEGDTTRSVIFSGDIGNTNQPLIRDPVYPKKADYVVMESTYGDRAHPRPPRSDYAQALAEVIQRTFDRGGNVVIPSFAVGRTQEMLYFIREIKEKHMVSGHEGFKVYVDSPLANEATQVFQKRMYEGGSSITSSTICGGRSAPSCLSVTRQREHRGGRSWRERIISGCSVRTSMSRRRSVSCRGCPDMPTMKDSCAGFPRWRQSRRRFLSHTARTMSRRSSGTG